MKQLMTTSADGMEEHLYLVSTRNKLFLHKNSTSPIHETRYATIYMYHVLSVHGDIQKPKIHYSLSDSFINQPVSCFTKKEVKSVDC